MKEQGEREREAEGRALCIFEEKLSDCLARVQEVKHTKSSFCETRTPFLLFLVFSVCVCVCVCVCETVRCSFLIIDK